MAEYVEQSTEEMLPELEQMCRVGLFTKKETSKILEKRKGHEYKLRRKQKQKEDFLQYIQYETNLLALVRKRRDRTGYTHKKIEIDNNITSRIHRLFKLALYRFPEDLKLWLSYIAFAKQLKALDLISRQYSKMLAVHDKKPDLWLSAAKWEFEDNNNSDNARKLLQRGLRFNPEARKLWLEYYRMELLYAEKTRKRRELLELGEDENSDTVLSGQVAFVVFDQARQAIPDDVSFLVQFLPICQLFDFTKDHEADICKELKEKYSEEPLAWDALAKRHLGRKEDLTVTDNPEKLFHDVYMDAISTLNSAHPIAQCWNRILKAFANSWDPDETPQNMVSHQDPNCLQAMHDFKAIQLCLPGEMAWDMPIGQDGRTYILVLIEPGK
ncbi:hypothetical protein DPMN_036683 [Dreissena polymorpha]|uniref:U3 small nucleolar RNA-associated protein 6 N-terminal domain-containing protein n=1 Tax=Dreissena polymorpha TaxID=45954 RepID=A0A9D4RNC6_DREPO|nr:hypothetical protein DPMN_036683 [Dreissena polymorpha]